MVTTKLDQRPIVSIILVNWNGIKWLDKCLASLTTQTYPNFEIILVDNNSTDNSVSFVTKNFPSVKVIKSPTNAGFASGNNLGINSARGEYIILLNTDTWVKPTFVADFYAESTASQADLVGPTELTYDGAS